MTKSSVVTIIPFFYLILCLVNGQNKFNDWSDYIKSCGQKTRERICNKPPCNGQKKETEHAYSQYQNAMQTYFRSFSRVVYKDEINNSVENISRLVCLMNCQRDQTCQQKVFHVEEGSHFGICFDFKTLTKKEMRKKDRKVLSATPAEVYNRI
ncbi:uncharacterized protein LOC130636673 [Hydractinia symbiolongicarpus]|uniref:uncharacterized protein LOC130636673 n=1 Tax=Hydractinia symbiolongicarpus TaxID=13093 RepID=UPI0025519A73|nr:uncharacterized protein LOC130636673 [Hydractinia symbiolongicarpus]